MPETFSVPWRDVVTLGVYLAGMVAFAVRVKSRLDYLESSTKERFSAMDAAAVGRFADLRSMFEGMVDRFSKKVDRLAGAVEESSRKLESVLQEHRAHAERLRSHERDIDRHEQQIDAVEKRVYGVNSGGIRGDPSER